MNFLQLEYFLCIYKERNISKAAQKLYISQPALSQQLLKLEHEMGTVFFYRHGSSLTPTYAGEKFMESAQKILFEYRKAHDTIEKISNGEHGALTLAVTQSKSLLALSYILPEFKKTYPNIQLRLHIVDAFQVENLLLEGKADIGFCNPPQNMPIKTIHMFDDEILVAVPPNHPINDNHHKMRGGYPILTPEELNNQYFILNSENERTRQLIDQYAAKHNICLNSLFEAHIRDFAHLLAASGLGLVFTPHLCTLIMLTHLEPPVYYTLDDPEMVLPFTLGYHKDAYVTQAMRSFIQFAGITFKNPPFVY